MTQTNHDLILLPGLLCDEEVWAYQVQYLSEISNIIIPKIGLADTPQKMITAILELAPETFALAGHSMGGWLALEIIRHYPHQVKKLCLLNTTAALDNSEKRQNRLKMMAAVNNNQSESVIDQLVQAFVYNTSVKDYVRKMFKKNLPFFESQQKAMLAREDCSQFLADITCPVIVLQTRHDLVFPLKTGQNLAASIPYAKLALIEGSGHMSPLEAPEAVTALMRLWLEYF